ncbi:MAG: hypothetical protein JWP87_156 [Labilithrix sp.]|nr:hypothetical protein [Labilithrix sp.]
MPDDAPNPYAPPAEPLRAFGDRDHDVGPNDYESERRPVLLCLLLGAVSLGFYSTIWLFRRRRFLDRLDAGKELGTGLPMFILVATIMSILLALNTETAKMRPLLSLAAGIGTIIANFRVLGILRSDCARTGRFLEFSTLGTFFFGIYYLQYKMNQMADTPARAESPRRKKRKKKKKAPELEAGTEPGAADAPPPPDETAP